ASKRLRIIFGDQGCFTSPQKVYKSLIDICLEYRCNSCHTSTRCPDAAQKKAVRVINSLTFTHALEPLDIRRRLASHTLAYQYYHGSCSQDKFDKPLVGSCESSWFSIALLGHSC
ncbi:uncharacterized protein LOC122243747, partial [Penaeus japonicus]|uniref:uncharacterized protein LOC122243747 n=1 Tax=Penaeus japonicus TaxID=27405 RepID=UPI001C7125C4